MAEIIDLYEKPEPLPAPDGTPVAERPGLVWYQGVWVPEDAWRELGREVA